MFVSSEFLRARQTAEECRAALQNILSFERQAMAEDSVGVGGDEVAEGGGEAQGGGGFSVDQEDVGGYDVSPPVVIRKELRERSFGELDGTILINYNKVHAVCVFMCWCTPCQVSALNIFGQRLLGPSAV